MNIFDKADYDKIHQLVFTPDYPGYKPTVVEIPNGDGKADIEKRYAHAAPKYFTDITTGLALMPYLQRAHDLAVEAAKALQLAPQFMPNINFGALRILEYPAGAVSNLHRDFDLFTLMCYRDQADKFIAEEVDSPQLQILKRFNAQAHVGELGAEVGIGPATPHEVIASDTTQHSIVYFSIPDHDAVLPSGLTVRAWLNQRMSRSRTEFKDYK